jgi:hypothetical protein
LTRAIANLSINVTNMAAYINRINVLSDALANYVITTAANSVGDVATGNGFITGSFGATTLVGTTLRGGSIAAAANLTISSNAIFNGALTVLSSANVFANGTTLTVTANTNLATLAVSGVATFTANVVFSNNVSFANPVFVTPTTFTGNVTFSNTTTFTAPVFFTNTIAASGNVAITGNTLAISAVSSFTANAGFANNTVDSIQLRNWKEQVTYIPNANATVNLDLSSTNIFRIEEAANTTFTFSSPPANNILQSWTMHIKRTANNVATTFPAAVKWDGGVMPPETITISAIDVWSVWTIDGGTTYIGELVRKDVK